VYNPVFLAHSLSSHEQSLSKKPELYTILKYFKKFYFPQYFPMHSEWSKTDFKQNSTCEWCQTLIFWPIIYLHMTNHCPKSKNCTPSGSILKNFYFPQYFPMHSELSKTDFKQNSTCEWCTTLIFLPIVHFYMTKHCLISQGCTPSWSILKNFYFLQCFPMHSEWSKTDFKKNSTYDGVQPWFSSQ